MAGAALMTIESAPERRSAGFRFRSHKRQPSVGIMLATGWFALCNHFLTQEEFLAQGWRIPFWPSAIMLIVGMFIRLHTEETLDFKNKNGCLTGTISTTVD